MMLQLVQSPSKRVQRLMEQHNCKLDRSLEASEHGSGSSSSGSTARQPSGLSADKPEVGLSEPVNKPPGFLGVAKSRAKLDRVAAAAAATLDEEEEEEEEERCQDELESPAELASTSSTSSSSSAPDGTFNLSETSRFFNRGGGGFIRASSFALSSSSSPAKVDQGERVAALDDASGQDQAKHRGVDPADCDEQDER